MIDIDARDAASVISTLRQSLRDKGDIGAFLLSRIDAVVAAGIEEYQDEVQYTSSGRSKRSGKKAVVRRRPSEAEALFMYARVLKSYLADLPAAASSARSDFVRYGPVTDVIVSFKSDLETAHIEREEVEDVTLSDAFRDIGSENAARGAELLVSLIRQAISEENGSVSAF